MTAKQRLIELSKKSSIQLLHTLPILVGGLLLYSLINAIFPNIPYENFFRKNIIWDSLVGGALGSFLSGEVFTSYIIGREFLDRGVSIVAVTAFLITWTSVAFTQIPFESAYLGRRFAIWRNIIAFMFALIIAICVSLII